MTTEEDAREYIKAWKAKHHQATTATRDNSNHNDAVALPTSSPIDTTDDLSHKATTTSGDGDPFKHKASGNALYSRIQWDLAISEYTAAIQCDPRDATYYSNRSACFLALQNNNKLALHDAVVARYLHPTRSKAAYRLAVSRLALCRHEDSAVVAWEGLQLDADNDELKSLLRKCVKLGRKDYQHNINNKYEQASK